MPCFSASAPRQILPPTDDDADLDAKIVDGLYLARYVGDGVRINAKALFALERLAAQLEKDSIVPWTVRYQAHSPSE